jgi:FdhD protein
MVHKAAMAGAPLLAAVSAPTQLAVQTAQQAGMGLVGLVRQGDLVIYAHPGRVVLPAYLGGARIKLRHVHDAR